MVAPLSPLEPVKSFRFYVKSAILLTDMLRIQAIVYNDMDQTVFFNFGLIFNW